MFKKIVVAVASTMALAGLGFPSMAAAAANPPVAAVTQKTDSLLPGQDFEGNWGGTLMGALRLILHVKKSPAGDYSAVLESVDQGHAMMPVDKLAITADHIAFSIASIRGSYDAKWDDNAKAWVGTWTQGQGMPLTLTRVNGEVAKAKRPQEEAIEAGPLPYSRQAVKFDGGEASVKLAGTFNLPQGTGPFPAVLLIAGSGPQTRDEDVLGHKEFLVLSDYLTRRGIAVLSYDKRGVGESSGDYNAATSDEFAADADAAVAYLRGRPEVDARHLGLIGHSEGGLIAPAVAVKDAQVGFIVLLAGPAMRGDRLLAEQFYLRAKAGGTSDSKGMSMRKVHEDMFAAIAEAPNQAEAKSRAAAIFDKAVEEHRTFADVDGSKANLDTLTSPWMRHFFAYDPVPTLRLVKVPVLALNGSLDLQVPPKENLEGIRKALSNNKDVTVMELPKLNHLFQSAGAGTLMEYGAIEETINPGALNIIADWVAAHTK